MGRKRNLSLYRSIKRRNGDNGREAGEMEFSPNYTKLIKVTEDEEINVVDDVLEGENNNGSTSDSGESVHVEVTKEDSFEVIENIQHKEQPSFKVKCIERLKDDSLIEKLVDNLDVEGNLEDFVNLIEQLASGQLPCNNIVLLLLLDQVRFQKCGNTVGMRYRRITKLFWSIVYRLCKGVGLKFFGGSKNWGQVVAKQCGKSKYEPHLSKINFAVPDEKVLRDMNCIMPKIIPPGKIRSTMRMIKDKEDIIIMGDAKLVTKGLKKDFC